MFTSRWLESLLQPMLYTTGTFRLFLADLILFVWLSLPWQPAGGLLSIVWPLCPWPSGALDELYPSRENLWSDAIHCLLFCAQTFFLGSLVWCLVTIVPASWFVGYIVLFIVGNMVFCQKLLSGPPGQKFFAGREFAKNPEDVGEKWVSKESSHHGEKWVFINGVAVGSHWMQSNLDRLSKTFRRPILGIHNPSYGIPFDVLESMFQRTFAFPTLDIRNAYKTLSELVNDDDIKKLVLIAHSQGAIEAGMMLDWVYATMPMEKVGKLEVFTFGNAANHWNNPTGVDSKPVIKHLEHYVNDGDWVARFGILHFRQTHNTSNETSSKSPSLDRTSEEKQPGGYQITPMTPDDKGKKKSTSELESSKREKDRFKGLIFKRTNCSGHQMNQHYLDNIFVMDEKLSNVLDGDGVSSQNRDAVDGNQLGMVRFMEMEFDRELFERDNVVVPVAPNQQHGQAANNLVQGGREGEKQAKPSKVKDKSRLWLYRNGNTPKDWINHDRKTQ